MVNKDSKNREGDTYYYTKQVMLLDILIILKASQVGYSIDYIFLQERHIVFKPFKEAVYIGFVGGLRLDYITLGLYPFVLSR